MTSRARLLEVGALAIAAAVVVSGCANSRSILYAGVSASGATPRAVSDAAASDDVQVQLAKWVADIARRGREDPSQQFANLTVPEFRRRLAAAAARYGFTVKAVEFFHPRQLAPLVIIETRHYLALAQAVRLFERSLNPHKGRSDLTGWAFEAFFLEAQDERGVPFLTAYDDLRGPSGYGGQWARSDQLYPFVHG